MAYTAFAYIQAAIAAGLLLGASLACIPGYTSNNGNCYKFSTDSKSWIAARAACQQTGGDLAVIDTSYEAESVKKLRLDRGKQNTYYWIGAKQDPHSRSPFQWIDGKPFSSQLWYPGEPNGINGRDLLCVDLGVTGQKLKMNDHPCSGSLHYMCEKKCPEGWYDGQYGKCYKFVNAAKSWYSAKISCAQMGGKLAVIDTQAEAEEIQLLRKNTGHKSNYYWIGAIQSSDAKGAFQWINGGRFYSSLWYSGEPSGVNRVTRQCVDLGVAGQQFQMNDWPCSNSLPYMCEKAL